MSLISAITAHRTTSVKIAIALSFQTVMNHCIVCELTVRPRQQALLCDGCQRWQHRTCNTGIGQDDYREAVCLDQSINWRCHSCKDVEEPPIPILNSTYLDADQGSPLLFSDHSFQADLSQSMVRSISFKAFI